MNDAQEALQANDYGRCIEMAKKVSPIFDLCLIPN